MIVRFRRGNVTETRPVNGKLDHHVSAGRKRDGYKQLPVSVEFTKYGNTLFRPVQLPVVIFDAREVSVYCSLCLLCTSGFTGGRRGPRPPLYLLNFVLFL